MNKIEAIILDLDGTLLDDNKKISEKTIDFLKRIKNNIKIIPASARQFCTIKPYLEKLDLLDDNNYTICFNGSLIVNNKQDEVFSLYIDKEVLLKIDNFVLNTKANWTYYSYDNRFLRSEIGDFNKFINENKIYKIVGVESSNVIEEVRQNLSQYILDNLQVTSSELNRIEFVAKGMTKVRAVELLLDRLKLTKENLLAIGDGDNDIEMIRYAGIGIAMLNSPEIVKENADVITKYTNNEDGVYHVLKELLS